MTDAMGFLFDVLGWRADLTPGGLRHFALRRGIPLPDTLNDSPDDEIEWGAAQDCITALRQGLAGSLLNGDATAGREALNRLLAAWGVHLLLEEELGPHELPGVELRATTVPPVPPRPHILFREGRDTPGIPLGERSVGPALLQAASVLLTEAANLHLSGYADRVGSCAAPDCRRPFLDTTQAGSRRFCSARCRARASARACARQSA